MKQRRVTHITDSLSVFIYDTKNTAFRELSSLLVFPYDCGLSCTLVCVVE